MNNHIPHTLEIIVEKSGLEQDKFAETLGLKKAAFNNYIKGRRELPKKVITLLMERYNVNPQVFFDENAPMYIRDIVDNDKEKQIIDFGTATNIIEVSPQTVKIPILGEIACGDPIYAEENFSGYRYESPDNLPSGRLIYLKAKGDSMEPTIPDGAYVMVREQPEVEYGEIAAVLVNGDTEATLKRVKKQGDIVLLVPDNPTHEPYVITEDNPAKIIGKAIKYTQDL